jgi:hypothetical protein
MKSQNKEGWLREAEINNCNVTFPPSDEDERRFWRGERRLTTVQIVGIAVLYAALAYPLWMLVHWMRYSLVSWVIVGIMAVFFGLLRWRVHKALKTNSRAGGPGF